MTGKEFDEVFKIKIDEVCRRIEARVIENNLQLFGGIQVMKFRDFIYGFKFTCVHPNSRSIRESVYTVMYNNKTSEYIWHEGYPETPQHDGKVIN